MMYIFKGKMRFPLWVNISAVVIITALRCMCTYLAYLDKSKLNDPNPGILVLVVFCILLIKSHWGMGLFSMLMLANIASFAVTAAKYLEGLFFYEYALQLHRWTNILMLVLVEAAVLIPLFFYIKHIYMKTLRQNPPNRACALMWLVPFTFYTVWFLNSFYATENHEILSLEFKYAFFCLLVNGGGMLIYTLVGYLINEHAENDRLRENEVQLMIKQKQFETLQERIEEARTAKHDMRQHLHMISAYLQDKKYDELEAYINSFRKTIPEGSAVSYCDHYGVNALLDFLRVWRGSTELRFPLTYSSPRTSRYPTTCLRWLWATCLKTLPRRA